MSLLALCPKFSLSFTRFLNENGRAHTLLFRCPAFQDLLLYLGLFTLEKRQWRGGFARELHLQVWKIFGSVFLWRKEGFCELLSKRHSLVFDHEKGANLYIVWKLRIFHSMRQKKKKWRTKHNKKNMAIKSKACLLKCRTILLLLLFLKKQQQAYKII